MFGFALLFVAGWASSTLTNRFGNAHAKPSMAEPDRGGPAGACVDDDAMRANANLVGQLHDVRGRLTRASEIEQLVATKQGTKSDRTDIHASLSTPNAAWARMADEKTLRLRTPCSSWSGIGRFGIINGQRIAPSVVMSTSEKQRRASVAGLSAAELTALNDAYARTHARTWASIKSTCEANEAYRKDLQDVIDARNAEPESDVDRDGPVRAPTPPPEPPDDELRISLCRGALLDMTTDTSRVAVTRVAELRAAGAGIDRASTDAERVLHALTTSSDHLYDEMVKTLGKELATRALDNGVLCTHETVYDARGPAPAPPPPVTEPAADEPAEG